MAYINKQLPKTVETSSTYIFTYVYIVKILQVLQMLYNTLQWPQ